MKKCRDLQRRIIEVQKLCEQAAGRWPPQSVSQDRPGQREEGKKVEEEKERKIDIVSRSTLVGSAACQVLLA